MLANERIFLSFAAASTLVLVSRLVLVARLASAPQGGGAEKPPLAAPSVAGTFYDGRGSRWERDPVRGSCRLLRVLETVPTVDELRAYEARRLFAEHPRTLNTDRCMSYGMRYHCR